MPYKKYNIRTGLHSSVEFSLLERDKEAVIYEDDSPVCAYAKGRMLEDWIAYSETFTADAGTEVLTIINFSNPFREGQVVRLSSSGTLPAGTNNSTSYFVINPTATTLQLSTSLGGSSINITDAGTGTHTIRRYNGYSDGDLNENPAYIAESILRDECYVERDLTITDGTITTTTVEIRNLLGSVDDFYHGAIYHNVTTDHKARVSSYGVSLRRISFSPADTNVDTNDKVYLTNVRGEEKINSVTFDKVGNSDTGLRDGWKLAKSIDQKTSAGSILNQLCYESHCTLFESSEGWKLVALDAETGSVDTWSVPLNRNSEREIVYISHSPLTAIKTDFRLKYDYSYGKKDYLKEITVNSRGYSNEYNTSLATEQNLCLYAEKQYKVSSKWEYSADWIHDTDTAILFIKKMVRWLTFQKLIVSWTGEQKTYMKYEKGDQVKINYSNMIPESKNNSSLFMITDKTVTVSKENPMVTFTLMEMI